MTVLLQTAPVNFPFDGTPTRGFVDLGAPVGIDAVNTERRFVIGYLSVNCPGPGMITAVRVALALNKANADGPKSFNFEVSDTNAGTQWTLRGPIIVPNLYSLFVYATLAGTPQICELLVFGGILSRLEGIDF